MRSQSHFGSCGSSFRTIVRSSWTALFGLGGSGTRRGGEAPSRNRLVSVSHAESGDWHAIVIFTVQTAEPHLREGSGQCDGLLRRNLIKPSPIFLPANT